MAANHIETYLIDHISGSVAGLEMVERLKAMDSNPSLARYAAELYEQITHERSILEGLAARLEIEPSLFRKAAGWTAEKLAELKLALDDSAEGPLRRLELVEGLSLGIEGKRLLWRSLNAAKAVRHDLDGVDFQDLERRAEDQRQRLEEFRIAAAKEALADAPAMLS
jgi:hypothetical protein